MNFNLDKSIEILERTPQVLESLLSGVSDGWLHGDEGPDTWSPYEVVGHLIHGEKTDWIPRTRIILSGVEDRTFEPFDRFAQAEEDPDRSMGELLAEFGRLRTERIAELRSLEIDESHLELTGTHPDLGVVTLRQLLSTWVVHDLGHIAQISRVMAKQYASEVGQWQAYLGILKR